MSSSWDAVLQRIEYGLLGIPNMNLLCSFVRICRSSWPFNFLISQVFVITAITVHCKRYTTISRLLNGEKCVMRLRVLNAWGTKLPSKPDEIVSFNVLFIDETGHAIQAICSPNMARRYRQLFSIGTVVKISNFVVQENLRTYRFAMCMSSIRFTDKTTIRPYDGPSVDIPMYVYDFIPFPIILERSPNNVQMTDAIGMFVAITYPPQASQGSKTTPKKVLKIKDASEIEIEVVLWPPFDDCLDENELLEKSLKVPIIMIFKGTCTKVFNGQTRLSTTSGTMIITDQTVFEVLEYQKSFNQAHVDVIDERNKERVLTAHNIPTKTIAELLALDPDTSEEKTFSCEATILGINDDQGWWYRGCPSCKKRVTYHESSYWCVTCGPASSYCPRYKVTLNVMDSTTTTSFLLFDSAAEKLWILPASKNWTSMTDYSMPPFMKKKIEGIRRSFHVNFNKNQSSGVSFVVRDIFDINDLESNTQLQNTPQSHSAANWDKGQTSATTTSRNSSKRTSSSLDDESSSTQTQKKREQALSGDNPNTEAD